MNRSLLGFIAWRLAGTAVLLLVLSLVAFTLAYLAPGDVVHSLLGPRPASLEVVAALRAKYHLDDSFAQQYLSWLLHMVRFDFGTSVRNDVPVTQLLASRTAVTAQLAAMAFVATLAVALPAAVMSGWKAGSGLDRSLSAIAILGASAPTFAVGLVLLYLFGVRWQLFPVFGVGRGTVDRLWHLVLPAITLALGVGAYVFNLTRTAVIAQLRQDYVAFARARGLGERYVAKLVLRNVAVTIITSSALVCAFLFSGTLLAEVTFALPGLGSLLASAVTFKDLPVVQSILLLTATVIALTALVADLLAVVIDPRIRFGAAQ